MGYLRYNEVKEEEKVIRLVKGEFEIYHGMSVDDFLKIYENIIKNHPEKLI